MMPINVICRCDVEVFDHSLAVVAVDGGLAYALNNQMTIEVAIGDFDSVPSELLTQYSGKIIEYNQIKNDSDLALAFDYLEHYSGVVNVYGALGKRFDHSWINLKLLYYRDLNIHYYDSDNHIFALNDGEFKIKKGNYKYLSLFTFADCLITISGVKYPLQAYQLKVSDTLNLSNEILAAEATIEVRGKVIVVLSDKITSPKQF
ncbi:MAG: thiamine diphosphokinase [Erysipelotrichaceae bacterium]